mmetsp:Transcript_8639/g.21258  ORF Transcript_8639/g.21258 Transcript_8639/m.21258 type:complete len:681 (+) Transcript_8639:1-2043(+)|eukprot:CAMPEP_0114510746 /NCGR_PEP_ID=MMETSP0109-20121206/13975_1 /TAXON_ID=29199 /ORGANISM="Chlorarachnion reptans, Strain CCCM449" /LENGTH=680 /DNA_ID=CAMNT_0001690121 /DNA_START=13 /DNA_END=2055 /DNA_ORIENTATION=-
MVVVEIIRTHPPQTNTEAPLSRMISPRSSTWLAVFLAALPFCMAGPDDFNYNHGDYDGIAESRYHTIYKSGRGKHFYSFTVFITCAITGIACLLIYMGVNRKNKKKLSDGCNALAFVSTAIFGISLCIVILSVFSGQGIEVRKWLPHRINDDKFLHDDYFGGSVSVAVLSLAVIVGNRLLQRFYFKIKDDEPEPGNGNKDGAVVVANRNTRYHELDHLKYYFIMGILMMAHFNRQNQWDGTDIAIHIFGRSHWMIGFAFITGYNSPLRYTDWIPRRTKRIFGYVLVYLWLQAAMILWIYYVCIPTIKKTFKTEKDQHRIIAQINPFCNYGDPRCNVEYLWEKDFILYMLRIPGHALWYVKAIFVWAVTIPAWLSFRTPVTLAFFAWMASKYFQADGANNTVGMLASAGAVEYWPWVVLGAAIKMYSYDKWAYKTLKTLPFNIAGWTVVFLLLSTCVGFPYDIKFLGMFLPQHGSMRSKAFDVQWWYMIGAFGWFIFTTTILISFVCIMPSFPTYFSRAGGNSFVAYALHFYIVLLIWSLDFYSPMLYDHSPQEPMFWKATILGAVVAALLMHPPIAKYLIYLVSPPIFPWLCFTSTEKKASKGKEKEGAITAGGKKAGKGEPKSFEALQAMWKTSVDWMQQLRLRSSSRRGPSKSKSVGEDDEDVESKTPLLTGSGKVDA